MVTCAQEHIKNCKKALSVVTHARSPYKPYVRTGNLPSGMTLNDYYMFVRKKMFVLTQGADAAASKGKKVNVQKGKGPALPALTAPHVDSIGSVLTMKSTTSRSIDAGEALARAAADEDGASVTTGGSFQSCNHPSNSTTSNDGRQLGNSCPVHQLEIDDDDDQESDKMPADWTFPGFISFVLLGPIVPPCLLPYRSEIMMPTLPSATHGDTTNGRAAMRKEKLVSKTYKKNGVATSPSKAPAVSLQQKIMIAGIAQSQLLMEQRQKNRANDRAISFYQKKVAAQRLLLLEQLKYMISVTPPEAPDRSELLGQLRVMNAALASAVTECLNAEEAILKDDAENDAKVVGSNSKFFIDLTIATVLGTAAEDDNCEVIAVTQERDSTVNASSSAVSSSSTKRNANHSGLTPISSNKKRKKNPPVHGWTMTSSPVDRLTEDVSPLLFDDSPTGEDDESK
ncbi:hypothetical protein MHU86_9132 [Fragilaria crotonensis]|nr:hypothetical protein MHU86_9132 [Fragilaria crotonensis]